MYLVYDMDSPSNETRLQFLFFFLLRTSIPSLYFDPLEHTFRASTYLLLYNYSRVTKLLQDFSFFVRKEGNIVEKETLKVIFTLDIVSRIYIFVWTIILHERVFNIKETFHVRNRRECT